MIPTFGNCAGTDPPRLYARLLEVFERETTILLMQGLMPDLPSSIA